MKDIIKQSRAAYLSLVVVIAVGIIVAVCWHSVEEIHYLKSFFPGSFSVQQAFYASGVELIKIVIISLPLVLIIFICLHLLGIFSGEHIKAVKKQSNKNN
jgi:hypothetical protein